MTNARISRCHVCTLRASPSLPFSIRLFPFSLRRVTSVSHLARTLPLVVALAAAVPTLHGAGRVAAARPASGITVVALGAPLTPEPVVADSARALALMVALRSRGAEGARAGPAAHTWHQVPGAGPTPVAVLAVGQAGAHAAAGVGVAHVAGSHAWIAHCGMTHRGFSLSA